MPSILFVCTGNQCRSPMAEALFRSQLARAGLDGWTVGSAGTWTQDGLPASIGAVQALATRGLDLSRHRSRQVTRDLLAQADLVLVMTRAHAEALAAEFPEARPRLRMLSGMGGLPYDIPDPIGRPLTDYLGTALEIGRLLERGFTRIVAEAQAAAASRAAEA